MLRKSRSSRMILSPDEKWEGQQVWCSYLGSCRHTLIFLLLSSPPCLQKGRSSLETPQPQNKSFQTEQVLPTKPARPNPSPKATNRRRMDFFSVHVSTSWNHLIPELKRLKSNHWHCMTRVATSLWSAWTSCRLSQKEWSSCAAPFPLPES